MKGDSAVLVLLFALALACIALGVFYFTVDTGFLADDFGRHNLHGVAFTAAGVVLILIGVVAMRTRRAK